MTSQLDFALTIEEIVKVHKLTYAEAVLRYCAENYLEPSEITKLVDGTLKDKLRTNFVDMGMLKKPAGFDGI